jgi:ATP-dependent Clp protease ATP-binding subunit ClpA
MNNYLQYGNILNQYGTNFTQLAKLGEFNECFGRDKELIELMEILVRKQKNNPVLVGDAGVGKTSVVELFATRIVENLVPFSLEGRLIIALNMGRILAGAKYKGEFEERFQSFIDEILNTPKIILFIDEIHTIVGGSASSTDGSLNAAELLKPILARGGLQCIGATTIKEYEVIEKDPALNRRFQPIQINEPTVEDTIKILYALRPSLESFHNIEISSQAIKLAAELSSRYIYDKFLPDKAIDIIDRVAAKEVIRYTNKDSNSLITAMINSSINHIGKLKIEAFRRNNIAVVYVLQEVENAYRNTLISWLENPLHLDFKINKNETLSSISEELVSKIRYSILANVDNLLFNFDKKNNIKEINSNIKNIFFLDNKIIYNKIINSFINKTNIFLNLYRISLLVYNLRFNIKIKKNFIINKNINFQIYCYIKKIINNNNKKLKYLSKNDFSIEDDKLILNSKSTLEITKNQIVNRFLSDLKPIINKGIIVSLNKTSDLNLSPKDLGIIYSLLGHTSKYNTKNLFKISDFNHKNKFNIRTKITEKHIYSIITQLTGVPLNFLSSNSNSNLLNLEATLHKRVIGQEEAISAISKAVRRSRLGIQNPKKPIASFLFCGPTGVGKTEVTKALTSSMFGSEKDMIRFDMSEFMEKHSISRLIGAPPGYVGYEDGGQLTNAVRRRSYAVILFDEIEKAHPDILNVLLQILDDGRLTDNQKRLVKFENTLIILTSNMGSSEIQRLLKPNDSEDLFIIKNDDDTYYDDKYFGSINFLNGKINKNFIKDIKLQLNNEFEISDEKSTKNLYTNDNLVLNSTNKKSIKDIRLKEIVLEKLNSFFLPEFLNRLDDIIIFQPLKPEELRKICDIMINELTLRLKEKNITLFVTENVKLKLTKEGYNPAFGARPLKRVITKKIEDLITDTILKNPTLNDSKTIKIKLNDKNQIVVY